MKKFLIVLVVLTIAMFGVNASAGYMMKIDGDTFMTMGVKARLGFTWENPGQNDYDYRIGNARIYAKGQITDTVKFFFNFDFGEAGVGNNAGRATDAAIMFDLSPAVKINVGNYRMAVSRVALQDAFQYIMVTAPVVATPAGISNGLAGYRGAGTTIWGDVAGGVFRYYVGAWDGDFGAPNGFEDAAGNAIARSDNRVGYSARAVFNFMDPEKGYACPGCYLGKANIFNVGIGYLGQDYDVLNPATGDPTGVERTYSVVALDAFYDAAGLTLEGGYLIYDLDDATPTQGGSKPTGWYLEGAYVVDKWQPALRYEQWDNDDQVAGANGDYKVSNIGLNYLIDGQNAKLGLQWRNLRWKNTAAAGEENVKTWLFQAQMMF